MAAHIAQSTYQGALAGVCIGALLTQGMLEKKACTQPSSTPLLHSCTSATIFSIGTLFTIGLTCLGRACGALIFKF